MQKTNTLLLVIIAGFLAGLLLKPAARRYEVFQQNYLLDTASGRVVLIQVSEEVKADQRAKEAAKLAEKDAAEARDKAYKEERLSKSCPEVLAKPLPKIAAREKGEVPISPILWRAISWRETRKNAKNGSARRQLNLHQSLVPDFIVLQNQRKKLLGNAQTTTSKSSASRMS